MQSNLLAHKILFFTFGEHKLENQPLYFEEECLEDEWAYGYWQLCGPARARCAYFLSVVHPQLKIHYIPSAWSTLYSPLYSGRVASRKSTLAPPGRGPSLGQLEAPNKRHRMEMHWAE